jgi:hypothetical protein
MASGSVGLTSDDTSIQPPWSALITCANIAVPMGGLVLGA